MDLTDKQWAVLENYLGMVHLACAQILLPAFMRCPLGLKQRAEYLGPASFEVAVSLESALQHILDSLLRFRPSQRGLKRSDSGEEPVGGRQRDMVDEILRGGDGTPVEGGDPARERVDEAVQFGVWKCPDDVSVSFRGIAVEIVRAENDFERPTAPDQMWKTFRTAAAGMHSHPDFGLAESRVLARREAHVAGEDELAAHPRTQPRILAMLTTGDLVRRTNVSIRIGRPEAPTAVMMFPILPVKSKWAR